MIQTQKLIERVIGTGALSKQPKTTGVCKTACFIDEFCDGDEDIALGRTAMETKATFMNTANSSLKYIEKANCTNGQI